MNTIDTSGVMASYTAMQQPAASPNRTPEPVTPDRTGGVDEAEARPDGDESRGRLVDTYA